MDAPCTASRSVRVGSPYPICGCLASFPLISFSRLILRFLALIGLPPLSVVYSRAAIDICPHYLFISILFSFFLPRLRLFVRSAFAMRFSLPAAALLSLALATGSHAQLPSSVTAGLSVQCLGGLAGLITNSALNQCLQLTEAVGAFGAAGQTSSLIPAFNTYLSNSICPGAPCNSTTIMTANSTIGTACSSELQNGTSIATVLSFLFSNYDSVRSAFCLEDTTQNNQLCVTQTLT